MNKDDNLELRGEIVIPGEVLVDGGKEHGDYTFLEGSKVKSNVFGLKSEKERNVSVIPLSGKYIPKEGDMVVGVVVNTLYNGWILDIDGPYRISLSHDDRDSRRDDRRDGRRDNRRDDRRDDRRGGRRDGRRDNRRDDRNSQDLRKIYKEGDLLSVMIKSVDEIKHSCAEGPRKLVGGRIAVISAKKVPRVIGNKKSMLELLRTKTGCRIVVGQNGLVWLDGPEEKMQVAINAILKIENESHTKGLTDRISHFLDQELGKKINGENDGR
ncbi:MAG: hypothetical protein JXB14_07030 [Candidatus Altiarchaeota archaeon]|nr:hypothetical protein [Candidatus Altiarchaeota archaeon]